MTMIRPIKQQKFTIEERYNAYLSGFPDSRNKSVTVE